MNNLNNIQYVKLVDTNKESITDQLMKISKDFTILTHVPFQDGLLISYADLSKIIAPEAKLKKSTIKHTEDKKD